MRKELSWSLVVGLFMPFILQAQWVIDGKAICTAAGEQYNASIISDGAGNAIIAWDDRRNDSADIFVQKVDTAGVVQWTLNGVAVCAALNNQVTPAVAADGSGGAIVAWQDYRSGNYDIYAQRVNAAGAVQWQADGVAICTAASDQLYPAVITDGSGGAIVVWQDYRNGNFDIHVQRVNASGVVQWTANGVAACAAAGNQIYPAVTAEGSGGAIVAWQDYRSGSFYDIYVQRVNASGAVQWTVNGVAICSASYDQEAAAIVSDGSGGAIIAWHDYRYGSTDIYAQRVNTSGAVQWTANGVAACAATGDQKYPMLAIDGASGIIATWIDSRAAANVWDIYAQRVNASGAVQWTANGVAICTANNTQSQSRLIADGSGGAIVVWQDYRSGNYDIYAQRVNAAGAVQWTANGVAACAAAGNQIGPALANDGAGGAIIAWTDSRNGNDNDIYAQRTSYIPGIAEMEQAERGIVTAHPNPFQNDVRIHYQFPKASIVDIAIFDLTGQRIKTLAQGLKNAGAYQAKWDGRDEKGNLAPGGLYFYGIVTVRSSVFKKIVRLRN